MTTTSDSKPLNPNDQPNYSATGAGAQTNGADHQGYMMSGPPMQMILSPYPVMMTCPNCNQQITTRVVYISGILTWILAILLGIVGFFLCLCLIPFFVDRCKDSIHSCPNCQYVLGNYRRL